MTTPSPAAFRTCFIRMCKHAVRAGRTGCSIRTRDDDQLVLRVAYDAATTTFSAELNPFWSEMPCEEQGGFQEACDRYIACEAGDNEVGAWSFTLADFLQEAADFKEVLVEARALLDLLLDWKLCGCGAGAVVDGGHVCFQCHLALDDGSLDAHECIVCMEQGFRQITLTTCCRKPLHPECLQRSLEVTRGTCPHCRCKTARGAAAT